MSGHDDNDVDDDAGSEGGDRKGREGEEAADAALAHVEARDDQAEALQLTRLVKAEAYESRSGEEGCACFGRTARQRRRQRQGRREREVIFRR